MRRARRDGEKAYHRDTLIYEGNGYEAEVPYEVVLQWDTDYTGSAWDVVDIMVGSYVTYYGNNNEEVRMPFSNFEDIITAAEMAEIYRLIEEAAGELV